MGELQFIAVEQSDRWVADALAPAELKVDLYSLEGNNQREREAAKKMLLFGSLKALAAGVVLQDVITSESEEREADLSLWKTESKCKTSSFPHDEITDTLFYCTALPPNVARQLDNLQKAGVLPGNCKKFLEGQWKVQHAQKAVMEGINRLYRVHNSGVWHRGETISPSTIMPYKCLVDMMSALYLTMGRMNTADLPLLRVYTVRRFVEAQEHWHEIAQGTVHYTKCQRVFNLVNTYYLVENKRKKLLGEKAERIIGRNGKMVEEVVTIVVPN